MNKPRHRIAAFLAVTAVALAGLTAVGNGVALADEAHPVPAKVDKVFARLDTDHDGRISRPEAEKGPRFANRFDRIDADRDGYVTRGELGAAIERARARRAEHPRR